MPRRIGCIVHNLYGAGLKRYLGDEWIDIPTTECVSDPEEWMRDIDDLYFSFLGKNLFPQVERAWESLCVPQLREAHGVYQWVLSNKPDSLLLWNDEQHKHRGAILAARALDIPVMELIHGNIHQAQPAHWLTDKSSDFQFGSWAFYDFHKLMEYSGTPIATGTISQDAYALDGESVLKARTTARMELQIPEHTPTVTYLTDAVFKRTPWMDEGLCYWTFTEFMKAWQQIRQIVPGIQLVVKVHPYEKMPDGEKIGSDEYKNLVEQWQQDDYIIVDDPLVVGIAPADVVVGRSSSAMATALHFNIPCLRLDYEPFYHQPEGLGCLRARGPADVLPLLSELLLDNDHMGNMIAATEKGVRYYSGAQDGQVVKRTAEAIRAITDRKEVPETCWCPLPDAQTTQPLLRSESEERLRQHRPPALPRG